MNVNWGSKIINIFKADMVLLQSTPTIIYQLDMNDVRQTLKELEYADAGMPNLRTHTNTAPQSIGNISLARVVEIINGYTVTFENESYAVNLENGNTNLADVTNLNLVQVRSANSVGLPNIEELQAASFNGVVHLDVNSVHTGDTFPVGTASFPVNNVPDARLIIVKFGLVEIDVNGDFIFDTGDDLDDIIVRGLGANENDFTFNVGASTLRTNVLNATISGVLDGGNFVERCIVNTLSFQDTTFFNCIFSALTFTILGTEDVFIIECYSGVPGVGSPIFELGSANTPIAFRAYSGGVRFINKTGDAPVSVDFISGNLLLETSNTNGVVVVRGSAEVHDENGILLCDSIYNGNLDLNNSTISTEMREVHRIHGLDPDHQLVVTPTKRTAGVVIEQTIEGDGRNLSKVTRIP